MNRLLIGGATATICISLLAWWHFNQMDAAYETGQRAERLVWQEAQNRAFAKAETDRKATQQKITQIETDYWRLSTVAAVKTAELKKALDNEKAVAGACAAVSRQLRDKLNAIGRRS
jgi:hypothetical protein